MKEKEETFLKRKQTVFCIISGRLPSYTPSRGYPPSPWVEVRASDSELLPIISHGVPLAAKSLFFVFIPLVLLIIASAKSASNSDDAKFISKLIANVVSAWNENNIEAIARVFLSDGILITPRGSVIRTRSEIRKRISSERQGKAKGYGPNPLDNQNVCAR